MNTIVFRRAVYKNSFDSAQESVCIAGIIQLVSRTILIHQLAFTAAVYDETVAVVSS